MFPRGRYDPVRSIETPRRFGPRSGSSVVAQPTLSHLIRPQVFDARSGRHRCVMGGSLSDRKGCGPAFRRPTGSPRSWGRPPRRAARAPPRSDWSGFRPLQTRWTRVESNNATLALAERIIDSGALCPLSVPGGSVDAQEVIAARLGVPEGDAAAFVKRFAEIDGAIHATTAHQKRPMVAAAGET